MKKLILPGSVLVKSKEQKGVLAIPGTIIIAAIVVTLALVFILGQRQPKSYTVPIDPSQLMPFASAAEARITICNLKKEELFARVCQSKFDSVSKEDVEKIVELFTLIEEVKKDKSISDYDRLLLANAIFAALPIGDNSENPESHNFYQRSLFSRLKDYLTGQITVYAKEQAMSEEEFKDLMKKDLQKIVDSLPKEDNAWVINIMVSKYSWKDGKSQPLYSHQYMESFDPFPNNPNVNKQDINYHVQSVVGSKASSQTADVGGSVYKGTSDMIGYSFTMMSWNSKEYISKEGGVDEQFLVGKNNFSESFYQGEYYLTGLLDAVKMPSTKRSIEIPDTNEPRNTNSKESPSPKPSAPTTVGASDGSSGDACKDRAAFCRAIEECASQITEANGKIQSYNERYQQCSQTYKEGWYEAAGWLSCPWWKEQEAKNACYESKCNPLSKEIEERRGGNAYLEWDKVVACMDECDVQAKQAAASLQLPKCEPANR